MVNFPRSTTFQSFAAYDAEKYCLLEFTDRNGKKNVSDRGPGNQMHDHHLEIEFLPNKRNARSGKGSYSVGNVVRGMFEFTRTPYGRFFNARYVDTPGPDRGFVLTPVRDKSGDIAGIAMTFAHLPNFVAYFGPQQAEKVRQKLSKPVRFASQDDMSDYTDSSVEVERETTETFGRSMTSVSLANREGFYQWRSQRDLFLPKEERQAKVKAAAKAEKHKSGYAQWKMNRQQTLTMRKQKSALCRPRQTLEVCRPRETLLSSKRQGHGLSYVKTRQANARDAAKKLLSSQRQQVPLHRGRSLPLQSQAPRVKTACVKQAQQAGSDDESSW